MSTILLIDCSPKMTQAVTELLGDNVEIKSTVFEEKMNLSSYSMAILESSDDQKYALQQIRNLRYACNFRDIPIIMVGESFNNAQIQPYIMAGATEALPLDAPPVACRQILQGYMIPGRQPMEEEMKYLNHFIKNTHTVLKKMAKMEVIFKEVYFSNDFRIFGDISGIIGLSGESEGTVVATFYWTLAREIIARMMNVQKDQVNSELIHDGVGEIINMIAGSTKKNLVGTPYHFELSLPSVVVGYGHQIGHPESVSIAVILFEVGHSAFAIQVGIKPD